MILSFLNQKGGAGKSVLATSTAVELAKMDVSVHVADMDFRQNTALHWSKDRTANSIIPEIPTTAQKNTKNALKKYDSCDVLIFDGSPYADAETLPMAKASDLIFIPTGISKADVRASIALGEELVSYGLDRGRVVFIVNKVPDNGEKEVEGTQDVIASMGFGVLQHWLGFKTGYSQSTDQGKSVTEASNFHLKSKARKLVKEILEVASKVNSNG